ncbi:MAG: hypothetical protein QOK13_1819 [Gaiellaceae bacterium]|jgi:hypothetical protein|nr:hypothetical protein [Gaiellaceae bacterium]
MTQRLHDRLFAGSGIASVVLMLAGTGIATLGHDRNLTISSSPSDVARGLAKPASAIYWTGAYIELLSFGFFLAFAIWACAKLGGGVLGQIARAAATGYATVSIGALAVMDATAYRSGKGIDVQLGTTLVTLTEALYVCTWFLAAFFLLAAGPLALAAGRRALGGSAIAVAVVQLVLTAVSVDNLGQMTFLLWLAWIVYASFALPRGERVRASATAVAQGA